MRIAYVYYEHPISISGGGIGTYVDQISKLMANRGHRVEVFSGTLGSASRSQIDGYNLNLIPALTKEEFRTHVVPVFAGRHSLVSFDLVESPEYGADALLIKKAFPQLPLTLKLHTPSFLTGKLNSYKSTTVDKLRFMLGGLLRGKIVKPYWVYNKDTDPEYKLFCMADSVSSPSISLKRIIKTKWSADKVISVIPYPFDISDELLKIKPSNISSSHIVITFIGKLEKRKGILDIIAAIPSVLNMFPNTIFRFVGKASISPDSKQDMISFIKSKLEPYKNSLEFMGHQHYSVITTILEQSHICLFPSLWENFPNVCLEAMAAGRIVIGTNNGGMADIISHKENGILIPPNSPKHISISICELLTNPHMSSKIGIAARQAILNKYNGEHIGELTETFYRNTISLNE